MRRVTSKNTRPEILVRKFLYNNGLRYRCNPKNLPGRPDIFILKYNVAIFIHGCLWHGHLNCKHSKLPKSNIEYWQSKIEKNVRRDTQVAEECVKLNLKTITIWTCELETVQKKADTLAKLIKEIKGLSN